MAGSTKHQAVNCPNLPTPPCLAQNDPREVPSPGRRGERNTCTESTKGTDLYRVHICSMKSSNSISSLSRVLQMPGRPCPCPSPSARYLSVSAMKKDGMSSRLELGLFTLCRLAKPYSLQLLGFIAACLLLDIHGFIPKKASPDKVETENLENNGKQGFAEFVAKQRLHSIKGDHQPLTPVPIDLQLGSPPHEIQAFNLSTIEGSYKMLQFSQKDCQAFLTLTLHIAIYVLVLRVNGPHPNGMVPK